MSNRESGPPKPKSNASHAICGTADTMLDRLFTAIAFFLLILMPLAIMLLCLAVILTRFL